MTRNNVCAVIVTYHPDKDVLENFKSIYEQVDKVVIVDNTPGQKLEILQKIQERFNKVEIIYNRVNLGIAKALNQGVIYAIENKFDWVLTMDQDSTLSNKMVQTMVETYLTIPEKDKIWAISPVFLDKKTQHLAKQKHINEKYYKISATLTSGMLVKTSIFTKIGFFDEKYFIYHVDTEYCFRARKYNYQIFEIPSAILYHQEGDQTRHSFLWKKNILVTNHSPIARYYISRNFIFLFKRYFFTNNISTLLKIIKGDFLVTSKLLFFEKNRVQKILKNIKGLVHGLINQGGVY